MRTAYGHATVTSTNRSRAAVRGTYDPDTRLTSLQIDPIVGYDATSTVRVEVHLATHELAALAQQLNTALEAALDDDAAIGNDTYHREQVLPARLDHLAGLIA